MATPSADGDGRTRCLLAVLNGASCWGAVIEVTGLSHGTVTKHLHRLRDDGMVTWDRGKRGTLRALVRTVPVGARRVA